MSRGLTLPEAPDPAATPSAAITVVTRGPFAWLAGAGLISGALIAFGGANPTEALHEFPIQVLGIYIALELFTQMVQATGLFDRLAIATATASRGDPRRVMVLFAALLMIVGLANNNITALTVAMPIMSVVLRAMSVPARYVQMAFALLLAVGNCAGAATPVGDFPALLIMAAGITTFGSYLVLALPLFTVTAVVLVLIYRRLAPDGTGTDDESTTPLAIALFHSRYRYRRVNGPAAWRLGIIFAAMVATWVVVPFDALPPMFIAWFGLAVGALATG